MIRSLAWPAGSFLLLPCLWAAAQTATVDTHEFSSSTESWMVNFGSSGVAEHTGGQNGTGLSASGGALTFTMNPSGDPAISTGFASRDLSRWDRVFVEVTASRTTTARVFHQSGTGYVFTQGEAVSLPAGITARVDAPLSGNGTDKSQVQAYGIRFSSNGQSTDIQIHRAGLAGPALPHTFSLPAPYGTEYWIVRSGQVTGNTVALGDPPPGNGLNRQSGAEGDGDGVLACSVPAGASAEISTDISREDIDLSSVDQMLFRLSSDAPLGVRPFIERTASLVRTSGPGSHIEGDGTIHEVLLDISGLSSRTDVRCYGLTLTNSSGGAANVRLDAVRSNEIAPPLAVLDVVPDEGPVGRYQRFGISFDLNREFAGAAPYNPAVIDVSAVFTSPTARSFVVPAFYTQDFSISNPSYEAYTATGAPYWRGNFAPDETGTYSYFLRAREPGGSAVGPEGAFEVVDSEEKGFIRIHSANPYYLQHDDGSRYLPLGHNIAFGDGNPANLNGTAYYAPLLSSLAGAKGNWTRIWMTDFERSAIEWSSGHWSGFYGGVGVYSLKAAYRIDKILELAQSHGIAVQLVLNDHGQFSSWVDARWSDNPYNSLNGGPVPSANPEQFFTNTAAIDLHKRRLRYLVARYGAFPNLLCWELFNEVQFIGQSNANWFSSASVRSGVRDWHAEMGSWLKSHDPFSHLVSTSSDGPDFGLLWSLPEIDLLQIHDYSAPSSDRDLLVRNSLRNLYSQFQKPAIVGEFGLGGSGASECSFNPNTYSGTSADREHLLQGTHLHNTLWAAAMTGTGAGLWWWGCYLEPDASESRTQPSFPLHAHHYPPLATFYEDEPLAEEGVAPADMTVTQGVVGFALASGNRAYAWIRDALNAFGTGAAPGNLQPVRTCSGVSVTFPGLGNDVYQVQFYDPWTGTNLGTQDTIAAGGQGLNIELPTFQRDIALKVRRQETLVPDWGWY